MPRKKRDLRRMGFIEKSGKGSHTVFRHPKLSYNISIAGADGDDADKYDEAFVRQAKYDLGV